MAAIVLAVNKNAAFLQILVNLTDRRTNKQFDFQLKHKNCTPRTNLKSLGYTVYCRHPFREMVLSVLITHIFFILINFL